LQSFLRTDTDDVELESALQQLLLNLLGDAVESDVALREDGVGQRVRSHGRHCRGKKVGGREEIEVVAAREDERYVSR